MNEDNIKNSETLEDNAISQPETDVTPENIAEEVVSNPEAVEAVADEAQEDVLTAEVAESLVEEESVISEELSDGETPEEIDEDQEVEQRDFIDDFAPAAIVIPNYNKEKELKLFFEFFFSYLFKNIHIVFITSRIKWARMVNRNECILFFSKIYFKFSTYIINKLLNLSF